MRYIAAYLLLKIGGNESPSAADIKKVLQAVGIEADDERLDSLLTELKGKDINAVCFLFLYFLAKNSIFYSIAYR
jgi:large subunit ribosomal protein LP2